MGTANVKRKYPDDRAREVFKAAKSGDAVLLNKVLQKMNSSERTSALETKMDASLRYGVNEYETFKVTPLIVAAKNGNVECVKVLLNYKADIEGRGGGDDGRGVKIDRKCSCRGCIPLIVAATYGNLNVLSCLIANGADVNARSKYNCTPLMIASRYGLVNVVTFLIEHGANMDLKDKTGKTALHYAVRYYRNGVLSCLIKHGADVNARIGEELCTLLMIASRNHNVDLVTFLIDHGANMDLQDKKGKTAIHYAVDSCDILSCLIRNGADVNACTKRNCTPLMIASLKGNMNTVTFLLEHGANMDQQDKNGDTALHYAVNAKLSKVAQKLLTLGASQLYNKQRLTPLLLASNICNVAMVESLINGPQCTKEQRIDALELIGASLATQPSSESVSGYIPEEAFKYMKRGMEERFEDPLNPLLKQQTEPIEAYQNRKESQTLEELAQIEGDNDAIMMEGFVMRERILGQHNLELLDPIRKLTEELQFGGFYCYDICVGLCTHAMKIAQCCNQSAIFELECLTFVFRDMVQDHNHPPCQKVVLKVFELTIPEYERERETLRAKIEKGRLFHRRGAVTERTLFRNDIHVPVFDHILQLLQFLAKDELCGECCKEDENSSMLLSLQKLCSLNPRDGSGNTLLHLAAAGRDPIRGHLWDYDNSPLFGFPCVKTVELLLNAGFNVNAVNNNGDTPLHRAASFNPRHLKNYHLITDMLQVLLDGGAHQDYTNNDGKTAMKIAINVRAYNFLSYRERLELKCISARAVKKFGLPYLGEVPKTLEKYISMH